MAASAELTATGGESFPLVTHTLKELLSCTGITSAMKTSEMFMKHICYLHLE
jgi:hypothetical protein